MRGHVGTETIAAFREDLLSGRKAARVAAHLAVCPQCAGVDAQLGAVTTVLAAVPAPPMPASLAARLDAALAAEAAARAAGAAAPAGGTVPAPGALPHATGAASPVPGAASPVPGAAGPAGPAAPAPRAAGLAGPAGPVGPARAPRHTAGAGRAGRWFSPLALRLAAATAAVVLLGGGGYVISQALAGGSSGVTASSAPGTAGAAQPSAARRPAISLAPEGGSPALGIVGLPVVASGTDYQPGQERAQVARVLRDNPTPGRTAGTKHASPAAATRFPRLAACVAAVTGGGQPRLVDIARYRGRPAAVIVLPVAGSQTVRVWIVGTGCPAHGGDVITTFTMAASG